MFRPVTFAALAWLAASPVEAQVTNNPFTAPIEATEGVVAVRFVEFAVIPDANGEAPRMMHMVDEPGSKRLLVSTMRGPIFSVSYDGKTVAEYVDVNAPAWKIGVQSQGTERGLQSIAFHPQFSQRGTRGYGKFYTYTDTPDITPKADFTHSGSGHTHDTVLLEWTAKNPAAAAYDGAAPRELLRFAQPFANHNGGEIAFNDLATPNTPEFGSRGQSVRQRQQARDDRRSSRMACAIRSASPGIPRIAACMSPTSARTSLKRSAP